ncbi:MAG: 50S ribosomal protein L24 [Alphaproteobacteria bacterium]|jgi:large subunit ribosomal protein L24|nr:50S ribosomal protein L24 [Alphaproteobacteria bacterium]
MQRIRKGDDVIVLAGRDKGKRGEVMSVFPKEDRAIVQGINLVKRHTKPSQTTQGGMVSKELSIHLSNLALIDPKTNEPTRVGYKLQEDGTKVRYAKKSGDVIDG